MKKDLLEGLTDAQIERFSKCRSNKEILEVAKEEGIELTSKQLEAVSGGACEPDGDTRNPKLCPKCGKTFTKFIRENDIGRMVWDDYECLNCGYEYRVVKSRY